MATTKASTIFSRAVLSRLIINNGGSRSSIAGVRRYSAAEATAADVGMNSIGFAGGLWLKDYEDYRRSLYGGKITHKALLVDAVGTLVVPAQPTAQIYREIGEKYGVKYSEDEILNRYRWAYEQPWGRSRLRFWWGSKEEKRRLHWVRWETLCLPKSMGGMGFRDLKVFNQAMLARQGWRLAINEGSLLHRTLKARYFPNSSFAESSLGHSPSYTWRSIWGAKSLLLEGLKIRVGDGRNINVWHDAWLPEGDSLLVPTPKPDSDMNLRVADLIDEEYGVWREQKVRETFNEEEVNIVLNLPLSIRLPKDEWYWWPSKDGAFTVKTAYWLGKVGHLRNWTLSHGPEASDLWRAIWNLNGPPKLRHFLWRSCSGFLAVFERLKARHLRDDDRCARCGCDPESIVHAILTCPAISGVWERSTFGQLLSDAPRESFSTVLGWFMDKLDGEELTIFATICWALWKARNEVIFDGHYPNLEVLVPGFLRYVRDFLEYSSKVHQQRGVPRQSPASWSCPPKGFVKVNVDAAFLPNGWLGLGVAIRDDRGSLMMLAVKRMKVVWAVNEAEAAAGRWGVQVALHLGFEKVFLESDSLTLINRLKTKSSGHSYFDLLVDDIVSVGAFFSAFEVGHVRRGGNTVAHLAARICPQGGYWQVFDCNYPEAILALVELDSMNGN